MGQTYQPAYQPGRWQEIEGVPDDTSDADMLAAVRNIVRAESPAPLPDQEQPPAPVRARQWQPAPAARPPQPQQAAAKEERALMTRLLDRLRG